MLDAYRIPGPVDPDLPARCAGPDEPRCPRPGPPLGASCADADPRRPLLPRRYARALSAAATAFLLMATAALAATTYAVVESLVAHREAVPQRAAQGFTTSSGPADVEDLWRRAEQLAESGEASLARATLPRSLADDAAAAGSIHVAPEPRTGGAVGRRVLSVGERGAAAIAGVRAGDFITAVNGVRFVAPSDGARAFAAARASRTVVAELLRDGKRVFLRVDWA